MMGWLSEWWHGGSAVVEPATLRDAARLAQLHVASFAHGWGEGEFESMISERNTLVHRLRLGRKTVGFAVSRIGADEAEILSIAVDGAYRGRGLSRTLLMTHLGHLPGAACAQYFSRWRKITSRRGGSTTGADSWWSGAAIATISSPTGNN